MSATIRTLQWLSNKLSNGDVSTAAFPSGVESNGNDVLEERSESSASPGFGSWRNPNADRPTLLFVAASAQTDGTTEGDVQVQVDKSGGAASDYEVPVANTPADNSGGATQEGASGGLYIPAGGSYQIVNVDDPNGANSILDVREATL